MEKIYERINWEDSPSENTPIDAENLNKMDSALDALDNRVAEMDERIAPVNNLLATEMGKPLDAVQGKELGDRVTTVENKIANCSVQRLTYTFDDGARVALSWEEMYSTTEDSVSISAVSSGKFTVVWYKLPDAFLAKYKENQIVSVTLNSNYLMVTYIETFLNNGNLVMKVFNSSSSSNELPVSSVQLNVLDFNNAG